MREGRKGKERRNAISVCIDEGRSTRLCGRFEGAHGCIPRHTEGAGLASAPRKSRSGSLPLQAPSSRSQNRAGGICFCQFSRACRCFFDGGGSNGANLNSLMTKTPVLRTPPEGGRQTSRPRHSASSHRPPRPALGLRQSTPSVAASTRVSSTWPSRYWGPHTTSRKCASAFLRRSCTAYTLSRGRVLPDGSPRTNLKKSFSSSSRKAPLQQRQHLRHPRQPTVHPVT